MIYTFFYPTNFIIYVHISIIVSIYFKIRLISCRKLGYKIVKSIKKHNNLNLH